MKFEKALEFLKEGERIRRKGECGWLTLNNGVLLCYTLNSDRIGKLVSFVKQLSLDDVRADDWEVLEDKKQWWEPKNKDLYWYISNEGEIHSWNFNKKFNTSSLNFGNCFQTKKQAEFMAEKLKVITKIRKYIAEKGQIEPHVIATRYYIYYNPLLKEVRVGVSQGGCGISSPFNLYFHSNQDAEECIKLIGKENLKKYYFGVEEDGRK